jgi:hypothetical protein
MITPQSCLVSDMRPLALNIWVSRPEQKFGTNRLSQRGKAVGTIIGIIVSVIVTVFVSRHYFRRSTRRCLKTYLLVDSEIFAGIEPEVREQLHFAFRGEEVRVLQQIEFLVANVGERAISGLIEPLRLKFPVGVRVLDALILHRSPDTLKASVTTESDAPENGGITVTINFPLLNKQDYFLIKILLGGLVKTEDLACSVVADDLPRSIKFEWLSHRALHEKKLKIEWSTVLVAVGLWVLAASIGWALFLLVRVRPDLFPYPWVSYRFSVVGIGIWPAAIAILLLILLGGLIGALGFEDLVARGPRFPIPDRLRRRAGFGHPPFGSERNLIRDFEHLPPPQKSTEAK